MTHKSEHQKDKQAVGREPTLSSRILFIWRERAVVFKGPTPC